MTVKLSITSIDKIKNEQRRYAKYLQWNDSFVVAFQSISEKGEKISDTPEDICFIKNENGEIILQNNSGKDIFIDGKRVQRNPIKDGDIVMLPNAIHLLFRVYGLSGKDLFKGSRTSKDPIIVNVVTREKAKKQVVDVTNPVGNEIDGYYFEDVLNYGNMGVVYKGVQKSLKRPVAIKTVAPKNLNNPTVVKRFMNMANLAWRLNHPYIVQIYDTGISQEFKMHYVVMEHIEGSTLREVLNRKKIDIEYTCKIISQLASALSFAHRQNIIHRDVNPTNIVVTKDSKEDYIKLIGLALSKVVDPDEDRIALTMKGQAMGTMGYISPEQAKSAADVDFRTDIYSLGVIFYECLCGKLPYESAALKDPKKYMKALRTKIKNTPHTVNPSIPKRLSQIVMKCLEPSPDRRYQKAEEVLDDIKTYTEAAQLSTAQKRVRAMFSKPPEIEGFDFHVTFEPMEEIGGDFYDFVPLENNKMGVVIGDVTGHGVEAAVVMGMVKSIVKVMAKNFEKASDVIEYSNKELSPDMDSTTFTTVFYGIIDIENKTFNFVRAGHNPLILYNPSRNPSLITFAPKGTILGVPWSLNLEEVTIQLIPGDMLIQYTDGITEAKSKKDEEFGMERLYEVVEQAGSGGLQAVMKAIKTTIAEFSKGSTEADDVTLVGFELKEEV